MRLALCLRLRRPFQILARVKRGALLGIGYGKLNADGEGGLMKANKLESSNLNLTITVKVAKRIFMMIS